MKSLKIGKAVKTILSGSEALRELLGGPNKVFPLIVNKGTKFPYIVYKRGELDYPDSKDRCIGKEVIYVDFVVISENYSSGLDIISELSDLLHHRTYTTPDLIISDCLVTDVDEDFLEDSFIQTLTVKFIIK